MLNKRKRDWAPIAVNMTPLIDVIFLIIIFFIMIMNITEILSGKVTLPTADESKESKEIEDLSITIKSEELIFVGIREVSLKDMEEILRQKYPEPGNQTLQLRGDEDVPYETVRKVMQAIAAVGITRINFSTRIETFDTNEKGMMK